jgi:hypothetical protein
VLESDDRRNPYRITGAGEKALRARLSAMQSIARIGGTAYVWLRYRYHAVGIRSS